MPGLSVARDGTWQIWFGMFVRFTMCGGRSLMDCSPTAARFPRSTDPMTTSNFSPTTAPASSQWPTSSGRRTRPPGFGPGLIKRMSLLSPGIRFRKRRSIIGTPPMPRGKRSRSIQSSPPIRSMNFSSTRTPARYQEAARLEGTVHFHANDTDGEWIITEEEDRTLSTLRGHGHADVALSAAASDLLLTLYRRITPEEAHIHGDKVVLDRFLARTDLD